jgi:hypothetical protein
MFILDSMFIISALKKQLAITFSLKIPKKHMSFTHSIIYYLQLAIIFIPIYILVSFAANQLAIPVPPAFLNIFGLNATSYFNLSKVLISFLFVLVFFPLSAIVNTLYFHFFGKFVFKAFKSNIKATSTAAVYAASNAIVLRWIMPFLLSPRTISIYNKLDLIILGWSTIVFAVSLIKLHKIKSFVDIISLIALIMALYAIYLFLNSLTTSAVIHFLLLWF